MNATNSTTEAAPALGVSPGSALPAWMNTPEKRRDIWAWQALAAAFVGDKEKADEYMAHAEREDRQCASPRMQNDRDDQRATSAERKLT